MKSFLLVVLILSILSFTACDTVREVEDKNPDLTIEAPDISEIGTKNSEVQLDSSRRFSYICYEATTGFRPYFNINDEFPGNIFIYETDTNHIDDEKLYGYMDEGFTALTNPISHSPNVFVEGLGTIESSEGSYVMNLTKYDGIEVCPGYMLIQDSLIRVDWDIEVPAHITVKSGIPMDTYLVPVKFQNGTEPFKWGYMTAEKYIAADSMDESLFSLPAVFDEARPFFNGLAAVRNGDLWGYVSEDGTLAIDFQYQMVKDFTEVSAFVFNGSMLTQYFSDIDNRNVYEGSWTLVDREGNSLTHFVSPYAITNVGEFSEGLAVIEYGKLGNSSKSQNYVNTDGEMLMDDVDAIRMTAFDDGRAVVGWGDYRYIDTSGETLFNKIFRRARGFSDGVAAVRLDRGMNAYTFIDENGNYITDKKFMTVCDFNNGYAFVIEKLNEPGYLIDKSGNEYLKELNIHSMSKFNDDGYAIAYSTIDNNESRQDKLYYMININNLP